MKNKTLLIAKAAAYLEVRFPIEFFQRKPFSLNFTLPATHLNRYCIAGQDLNEGQMVNDMMQELRALPSQILNLFKKSRSVSCIRVIISILTWLHNLTKAWSLYQNIH